MKRQHFSGISPNVAMTSLCFLQDVRRAVWLSDMSNSEEKSFEIDLPGLHDLHIWNVGIAEPDDDNLTS